MTEISLEEAYSTSCRLLGEGQVREQFLIKEIERLSDEVERLTQAHQSVVDELASSHASFQKPKKES